MSHYHALVWLDHVEAHVLHISPDDVENSLIQTHQPHHKLHSRAGTLGDGRAPVDLAYFQRVSEALTGVSEILIVGPAQAKLHLLKHMHVHAKELVSKVVGVETVDHPTDAQLVAYARHYFLSKDKML